MITIKSKLDLFFVGGDIYSSLAIIFLIKQDCQKRDKQVAWLNIKFLALID